MVAATTWIYYNIQICMIYIYWDIKIRAWAIDEKSTKQYECYHGKLMAVLSWFKFPIPINTQAHQMHWKCEFDYDNYTKTW